jgi:hypothetical protein
MSRLREWVQGGISPARLIVRRRWARFRLFDGWDELRQLLGIQGIFDCREELS